MFKSLGISIVVLAMSGVVLAQAPKKNPREAVESYLTAALKGEPKVAAQFAKGSSARESKINDLAEEIKALGVKTVSIETVYVGKGKVEAAIGVSEPIKTTDGNRFLFLTLSEENGKWVVHDVDFESESSLKEEVKKYLGKNPDAKKIPK